MGSTVRTMALVTVVRSMDTHKIIRQTNILLKIFLCFDIFFIVSFIVQLVWLSSIFLGGFREGAAVWNLHFLTTQRFVHGYCFIGFFSGLSSAIVWPLLGFEDGTNGMSCHGCLSTQLSKYSSSLASSTRFFTNPSILAKSSSSS